MALYNTSFDFETIHNNLLEKKSVYFIGIGGVSMSCLAEICHERGLKVGGSDRTPSAITRALEEKGITVFHSHRAQQVQGYGIIVYTLAIDPSNEEYRAVIDNNMLCVSRANFLGYLMSDYKNRIGVSGMHGKSTTTAMLASVFSAAKTQPTVVSGAALSREEGCYRAGGKNFFLYEACEYMDSFLSFAPTVAIVLNIELDHTDYFPDLQAVCASFEKSLQLLPSNGLAVLNFDDENVMRIARKAYHADIVTFGLGEGADVRAVDITSTHGACEFTVIIRGQKQGRVVLQIPGHHHIYNALATIAAADRFDLDFDAVKQGLAAFRGARRRMEYHATLDGVEIYEDYAHHPTEIKATLETAKQMTDGEVWCVFQSHTYSRTAELFDDFAVSLSLADHALILPIYAARETDTRGVDEKKLALALSCHSDSAKSFKEAASYIREHAKSGDLVIIMGAGDVSHVLDELEICF